jgi:acyl-CoA thioesterase FadM
VAAEAAFTSPLRFEDAFEVRLFLDERRAKVLRWRFEFVRTGEVEPCATGRTTVVFARREGDGLRSAPLPDDLVTALDGALDGALDRGATP